MKNTILYLLVSLPGLLTSCAFDYAKQGDFKYASGRLGTDTELRSLHSDSSGLTLLVTGERNSESFRQATNLGKWWVAGSALKSVANTAASAYSVAKNTQLSATQAAEATKQAAIQASTDQAAIAAEAAAVAP